MLEEILSRLPIKGATKQGGVPWADHLVITAANGKLDASLIPGLAELNLSSTGITFTNNYEHFAANRPNSLLALTPLNVQAAIEGLDLTKLSRAQLFLDIDEGNRPEAFNNIKQSALDTYTGVVELATPAETQTGTDTARAITPAAASATYLKLTGGTVSGIVNVPTPTNSLNVSQVVNQQFVRELVSAASILQINSPNISWVNTSGNNTLARRGVMNAPFATPEAALVASTAGDTIVVLPGIYNITSSLLKNGITWLLYPGVVFSHSCPANTGMFDDSSGSLICTVLGYGTFSSSGPSKPIININNQSSISIEAGQITSYGSTTISTANAVSFSLRAASVTSWDALALSVSTGNNSIDVGDLTYNYQSSGPTRLANVLGGTTYLRFNTLTSSKGGLYVSAGALTIEGRAIQTVGTSLHVVGGTVNCNVITVKNTDNAGTAVCLLSGNAVCRVRGSKIENTGTHVDSKAFSLIGNAVTLALRDTDLVSGTNSTNSIVGSSLVTVNVRSYTNANLPVSSNIALTGGMFEII